MSKLRSNKIAGILFVIIGIGNLIFSAVSYIMDSLELRRIGLSVATGILFLFAGITFLRKKRN